MSKLEAMRTITNAELTPADVPPADADWQAIADFALTFDGYERWGSFEKCAEIANAELHDSLDHLRTCLFFEQRRWRHYGDEPDEEALAYWRRIVAGIRTMVSDENRT